MFFYIIFRNRSVLWVSHHGEREKGTPARRRGRLTDGPSYGMAKLRVPAMLMVSKYNAPSLGGDGSCSVDVKRRKGKGFWRFAVGPLVDLGCRRLGAASSGSGRWGCRARDGFNLVCPGYNFLLDFQCDYATFYLSNLQT